MRRTLTALALAAGLLAPTAVPAAETEPTPEAKRDRLAELRRQREDQAARRDRAHVQFFTYGLPQYSLEAEAASKEIERLDAELAKAETEAGAEMEKAER